MGFTRFISKLFLLSVLSILAACTSAKEAPIIEGWKQADFSGDYRVQPGDSIYSIAWAFAMDYRELARFNQLSEPYSLQEGQWLRMSAPPRLVRRDAKLSGPYALNSGVPPQRLKSSARSNVKVSPPLIRSKSVNKNWQCPTQGKIARGYSAAFGGNRGIDISGKLNQPVIATAAGKVVYIGSSIPGYGKLIIIKHSENELSAYAFNNTIAVTEGQTVKAGQAISSMGKNERGQPMLHFEIRVRGKPVNPLNYFAI